MGKYSIFFSLLSSFILHYSSTSVESRHILAVFPYQGKSHQIIFRSHLRVLLEAGHNITAFIAEPLQGDFHNLQQIICKRASTTRWADMFEFKEQTTRSFHNFLIDLEILSETFMHPLYESKEFQTLVGNNNSDFDLVLLGTYFMQEPLIFLSHRFGIPAVAVATTMADAKQDLMSGRPRNPALEPEWKSCVTSHTMSFSQRFVNTIRWFINIYEHKFYYWPKREADLKRFVSYSGMETLPPLEELLESISLHLINSHPLVQFPTPNPTNYIGTPGLHIQPNPTLPKELQSLMDKAEDGVVLFSLGTNVPVSKMREEREAFIKAFGHIPQLVLWKSDSDIPNLPSNVKLFDWLPQQAILAHKNCRAFITHGGMLSKQEAVYFGVPLLTIPLFGDQFANAGHSEAAGLGITLDFSQLTEDTILSSLRTLIHDKTYTTRMEEYSRIFREDVSQSAGKVRYWIERIAKYKGADYLRRKTELYWFQYYLLDVIAFIFVTVVFIMFVLIKSVQTLIYLPSLFSLSKSNKSVKLKKK